MQILKTLTAASLAVIASTASAWWGGPWGGNNWGNSYNNGYGSGRGQLSGEQYRGGDASGGGDFGMNLSGRGNSNMRGYGSGHGAGDGWGRGYGYSRPYYGGYAPYGYMRQPMVGTPPGYAAMPQPEADAARPGAGYGAAEPTPVASGTIVTDAAGMTLYTFAQDSEGVSNCYGQCSSNWPPAPVANTDALGEGLTAIERRDGTSQLALNGRPLYRWAGDKQPGDVSGDGVGGVWSVARR
jgi:predicted lipoprotein with Yx(FWY)xxD motif